MTRLQCRGLIARAAVVAALFSCSSADAQIFHDPDPYQPNGWLLRAGYTGYRYEIADQAKAGRRLHHFQAKFRGDAERGDRAAMDLDARRIDYLNYRIAVDQWLIR